MHTTFLLLKLKIMPEIIIRHSMLFLLFCQKMMHLNIPVVEVEELAENGEIQKGQKVSFNSTLMAVVRYVLEIDCGGKESWNS